MNLAKLINAVKKHKNYNETGMILCHNGVVRNTSNNGKKVSKLIVTVNHDKLQQVIQHYKKRTGIIEILVQIAENKDLRVGDDIMFLVVVGDKRNNVIETLNDVLNDIKNMATKKTEFFTH